jgi:hypothetical protein
MEVLSGTNKDNKALPGSNLAVAQNTANSREQDTKHRETMQGFKDIVTAVKDNKGVAGISVQPSDFPNG